MSQNLPRKVLQAFKSLHITRKRVFKGDENALAKAREQINAEYKKCKEVSDVGAIEELIAYSRAVEDELRSTVIQARQIQPGQYEVRIRDDIAKLDNIPFKECGS